MNCDQCKNQKWHREGKTPMQKAEFSGCALRPAYEYFSRLRERECKDYVAKVAA